MPGKNIVKEYKENAYYHLYNRGVAKGNIFLDEQDYKVFLSYLMIYLSPEIKNKDILKIPPSRQLKNYVEQMDLVCYCLMPNHFHLLVFQKDQQTINFFMKSLGTKYSMYFNKKYKRVGPLFQGTYKAVEVKNEEQLLYLTKYIHRNPLGLLPTGINLEGYKYSSYINYLGLTNQMWVKPNDILEAYFPKGKNQSYKNFVEEIDERDFPLVKDVGLDLDLQG